MKYLSTIIKKYTGKLSLQGTLLCNRMRTSRAYLLCAPAHRAYRSYLQEMIHNRAFVYALVIVPVSSLSVVLPPASDVAAQDPEIVQETSAPSSLATSHIEDMSLSLDESITFTFDEEISRYDISTSIHPSNPVDTQLSANGKEITIIPHNLWKPDTAYSIALTHTSSDGPAKLYHFRSHGYPQIADYTPGKEQKNVVITEGTHLDISLDRPIDDFDFRVVSRKNFPFTQEVLPEERIIRLTFTGSIDDYGETSFILYAKHTKQSRDEFFPVGSADFTARAPQPTQWPEDAQERIALSVERTIPKVTEGKYIDINVAARLTTLFVDGVAIGSYVNSPGAEETPTITGEFKIENKGLKPLSRSFGVYLPYWMAFTPDGLYGIHDLVEWPAEHPDFPDSPGGGKESISSIDAAVSPGCVRHDSDNSLALYEWTDVGTPVIIY